MGSRPFQDGAGRGQFFFIGIVFYNDERGWVGLSSRSPLSLARGRQRKLDVLFIVRDKVDDF
jgi:hypothetical protein